MWFAPSSERWSLVVTLFGRGVGCCLATGLPLGCEVVFVRGVWYSLCCNKSSSVEVPSVGDSGLEILHGGEGGDVELGARTSKHILLLAFDPLSPNSLSLYIMHSIIHSIISICLCLSIDSYCHIFYMLGLLCVPHLYLTTRASYSTSTHI